MRVSSIWRDKTNLTRGMLSGLEFIKTFPHVIYYKKGKENVVSNALSRRYTLFYILNNKLLGFEFIKDFYAMNEDFGDAYVAR